MTTDKCNEGSVLAIQTLIEVHCRRANLAIIRAPDATPGLERLRDHVKPTNLQNAIPIAAEQSCNVVSRPEMK